MDEDRDQQRHPACLVSLPDREWLTAADVAVLLQLSQRTVYRLLRSGKLPGVRVGGSLRIPRGALTALPECTSGQRDDDCV